MSRRWLALALLGALLVLAGCWRVPVAPRYLWPGERPADAPRGDPGWLKARRDNLDPELRDWVDRSLLIPSGQILVRGDWAYILITWTPAEGLVPRVVDVVSDGGNTVALVDFFSPTVEDEGYALAVVRHGGSEIDFRHASGIWTIPRLGDPALARPAVARVGGLHLYEPAEGARVGPVLHTTGLSRSSVTYQLLMPGDGDDAWDVLSSGTLLDRVEMGMWTHFAADIPIPLPGYSPEIDDGELHGLVLRLVSGGNHLDVPLMARGAVRLAAHPAPVMCPGATHLAYCVPEPDGEVRTVGVWATGMPWPDEPLFTVPPGERVSGPMTFNPVSPYLAVVTGCDGGYRINLVDYVRGGSDVIAEPDQRPSSLSWSRDGRYLLWHSPPVWYDMSTGRGTDLTPLLLGQDGETETEMARAFLLSDLGIRLACSILSGGEEDLWVLDLHAGTRDRITEGGLGGYPAAWVNNDGTIVFTTGAQGQELYQGLGIAPAAGPRGMEVIPHGQGRTVHLAGTDPSGRHLIVGSMGPGSERATLVVDTESGSTWELFDGWIPHGAVFYEEDDAVMALVHVGMDPVEQLWRLDPETMIARMVLERDRPLAVLAVSHPHAYFTERAPHEPVDAVSFGRVNVLTGHLLWIR